MIPHNPAHCSHCILPDYYKRGSPCEDHRGVDGEPVPYTGQDSYKPGEWAKRIVGSVLKGPDAYAKLQQRKWLCFGYDPRHGFWLRSNDDGLPERTMNVSERAIDRTFHRIHQIAV